MKIIFSILKLKRKTKYLDVVFETMYDVFEK